MSLSDLSLFQEASSRNFVEEESFKFEKLRKLYSCAIDVTRNYLGVPTFPFTANAREVYEFVHELCEDLHPIVKRDVEIELSDKPIEPRQILVDVTVNGAKIVEPIFSESTFIFVKLWVDGDKKEFTSAKNIKQSENWNESFKLNVGMYWKDNINFELWMVRSQKVIRSVNSNRLRGPGSSLWSNPLSSCGALSERNSAFFIGKASENVKVLPSVPEALSVKLSNENIPLNLNAEIIATIGLTTKANFLNEMQFELHILLIELCCGKQLEKEQCFRPWKSWLDILPIPSLTLIHQHAVQYGFTTTEQTLSAWLVACALKVNKENRVCYSLLRKLLEDLMVQSIDNPLSPDLIKAYHESTTQFLQFSASEIENLHENFTWTTGDGIEEVYDFLRCISIIESKINSNYSSYQPILAEESRQYYLSIFQLAQQELMDIQPVKYNIDGLKAILTEFITNQIYLDELFMRTWNVNYTFMVYKQLDNIMVNIVKPLVNHLGAKTKTRRDKRLEEVIRMLQLYHYVRNLVEYVINQLPLNTETLQMESFSSWFPEGLVACWFTMSRECTKTYILRAVNCDKMEALNSVIKHGTSAPDVVNIIDEMVVVIWTKLPWEYQFYTHSILNDAIQRCAVDYFEAMQKQCYRKKFFCSKKTFSISIELCVALSNIYAVYEHLHVTRERIQNMLITTQREHGFALVDSSTVFQEELLRSVSHAYLMVVKKIKERLQELITNMLRAGDSRAFFKGKMALCDFVEQCLETMYFNLKCEPFTIILKAVWIAIIDTLYEKTHKSSMVFLMCSKSRVLITANEALDQLEEIFNCKGKGLTYYEMRNKKYKALKVSLEE